MILESLLWLIEAHASFQLQVLDRHECPLRFQVPEESFTDKVKQGSSKSHFLSCMQSHDRVLLVCSKVCNTNKNTHHDYWDEGTKQWRVSTYLEKKWGTITNWAPVLTIILVIKGRFNIFSDKSCKIGYDLVWIPLHRIDNHAQTGAACKPITQTLPIKY